MLARSTLLIAIVACLLSATAANAATIVLIDATTLNGDFDVAGPWVYAGGAAFNGGTGNPAGSGQLGGLGSQFSQTVVVPTTASSLNLSWHEAGAVGGPFSVFLGTQNLAGAQGTAGGQPFPSPVSFVGIVPTVSGAQLFRFVNSVGGGSPSSFIDNIVLTAIVPSMRLTPTGDANQDVTVTDSPTNTTGTVSFGNVLIGNVGTRSIEVQNVLTATGNDIRFNGTGAGPFAPIANSGNNAVGIGAQIAQNYTFTPTTRTGVVPLTQNITIVDDGDRNGTLGQATDDTVTVELSGRGVAPVANVGAVSNTTNANFADSSGRVRIGNSSTFSVQITNTGDGNLSGLGAVSNLNGNYSSAAPAGWVAGSTAGAISLGDSGNQVLSYTFTPTTFGPSNRTIGLDFTNGGGNENSATLADTTVNLNATGVGPSLVATYAAATGAGTSANPANGAPTALPTTNANNITFSQILVGQQTSVVLTLSNDSPSADLGNLTDLTTSITNALAGTPFSISSTVGDALIENTADTLQLTLTFAPTSSGIFNGFFTLNTDQGAAFLGDGQDFRFNLSGSAFAVPEPMTIAIWSVLGVAAVGYVIRRKRK